MDKTVEFKKNYNSDDFFWCYSIHDRNPHEQMTVVDGWMRNDAPGIKDREAFIGLLLKEKQPVGTKVSCKCAFNEQGAPMIVYSDAVREENGDCIYENRIEIVVYTGGVNVWTVKNDEENRKYISKRIAFSSFAIKENETVDLSVKIEKDELIINANGHNFGFKTEFIPKDGMFVGIMACEGPCRFNSVSVQNTEK